MNYIGSWPNSSNASHQIVPFKVHVSYKLLLRGATNLITPTGSVFGLQIKVNSVQITADYSRKDITY
jgi:hypothetical protein